MKVKVLFFGILTEIIGKDEYEFNNVSDINSLMIELVKLFPNIKEKKILIALNSKVIKGNLALSNGDEIALLPPFAGG